MYVKKKIKKKRKKKEKSNMILVTYKHIHNSVGIFINVQRIKLIKIKRNIEHKYLQDLQL